MSKKKSRRRAPDRLTHPEEHRNTYARTGNEISAFELLRAVLTQRERANHLPHLTPQKAASLYESYLKGELAEVQLVWKQLEEYDATLGTVLHARQSALAEMQWRVEEDTELTAGNGELETLAKRQKAHLNALLRGVDNLEEALVHLGMADFRGVAALEITGDATRQVWNVIEPWNLVKPVLHGPWMYNRAADTTCPYPEELDAEAVIIREGRALDLAAMFLILAKTHALQGWDTFLDVFGVPSVFAEMPVSMPEDKALAFDAVVKQIVADGRGTIPAGTKLQTVETSKENPDAFATRAKWCDDALIKLGLGGLLTVQAEAGSGTLAGNAHADSFERLTAASARSISRAVDTQYCRRALRERFGSRTPLLVHFVFAPQETEDRAANATLLATAKSAGWQPDADTASNLLGFPALPAPAAAEGFGVASPPMVANRAAAEGSRLRAEGATPRQAGVASRAPEPQPDSAPLSAEELEAINALANGGLNQEQIAQDAAAAADALAQAVQPARNAVANTDNDGNKGDDECHAKDPAHCPYHHPEQKKGQKKQFPKRTEVRTPEQRLNDFRERCKSMSDFEIYKNAKQYLLDDETMQDVIAFKANRKEFERSLAQKLQGKTVVRSPHDPVPHVNFVMRSIEEMSTDHALDRSVRLGCSVAEHKEAAEKADQFIQSAKWTGKRPGGTGKHKDEKNVVAIHSLEHAFISNSGNKCIAVYTVHEMRDNKFRAYFLYTKRDAEAL